MFVEPTRAIIFYTPGPHPRRRARRAVALGAIFKFGRPKGVAYNFPER